MNGVSKLDQDPGMVLRRLPISCARVWDILRLYDKTIPPPPRTTCKLETRLYQLCFHVGLVCYALLAFRLLVLDQLYPSGLRT